MEVISDRVAFLVVLVQALAQTSFVVGLVFMVKHFLWPWYVVLIVAGAGLYLWSTWRLKKEQIDRILHDPTLPDLPPDRSPRVDRTPPDSKIKRWH